MRKHSVQTVLRSSVIVLGMIFFFAGILMADTFIVTNTNDSGAGSLRQAIENSNGHTGADTIIFNIPDTDSRYDAVKGIWMIIPSSPFPMLSADSMVLDGTTQAAFTGGDPNPSGPEIVINGSSAQGQECLSIASSQNTVKSITINGGWASGISIYGDNNKIYGCFIGPDYSGGGRVSGQGYGIFISMGAADNIIGGTEEGERNIISGNKYSGLVIKNGAYDNHVSGNYIGITSTGTDTLGNLSYGIDLTDGAKNNIIGPGNIISGNKNHGICIGESGTDSNYVIGNYIGTDAEGTVCAGNNGSGVMIQNKAKYNIIGGVAENERNIISGNIYNGVQIFGDSTSFNVLTGNYIGLSAAGDSLGNNVNGVSIIYYASHNVIGPGNVISSNKSNGIALSYNYPSRNIIKGNLVGTDPLGIESRGNKLNGIFISSGKGNIIGGSLPDDRNIISGNEGSGIRIYSSSNQSDSTEVIGNYIGTDISGTGNLDNKYYGISITGTLQNITCSLNVVSGNELSGLYMSGSISNSIISNNKIGVDVTGTGELGNKQYGIQLFSGCSNNEIGPGNVVAYNKYNGIYIYGNSIQNRITENSIFNNGWKGIDNSNGGNTELTPPVITEFGSVIGTAPPNSLVEIFSGVDKQGGQNFEGYIQADDTGHFIWEGIITGPWITATATDADGNTSEFSEAKLYGNIVVTTTADTGEGSLRNAIELANSSTGSDTIIFNIPDTDPGFNGTVWVISPKSQLPSLEDSCTAVIGETQTEYDSDTNPDGPEIMLDGRSSLISRCFNLYSSDNTISGMVISGFTTGIGMYGTKCTHNKIINNYLGTNAAGNDAIPNSTGIYINSAGGENYIGEPGKGNVISGNLYRGIYMLYSSNNYILDNIIGLSADGTKSVPNQYEGIYLFESGKNIIGSDEGGRNIISGNFKHGINISGEKAVENHVCNNYIGTDITGTKALGNYYNGVSIFGKAKHNIIGIGNIVGGNRKCGISISGAGTDSNYVFGNRIGLDATGQDTVPNYRYGVYVDIKAKYNVVGGPNEQDRNIISGNAYAGIFCSDSAAYNLFQNNYIGTDVSGIKDLGNGSYGVELGGFVNIYEDNLISGNRGGIKFVNSIGSNIIRNNKIGVQADGLSPLPNDEHGVRVSGYTSCDTIGPSNVIWYNKLYGIYLSGSNVKKILITENSISNNGSGGIHSYNGANNNLAAPVITGKDPVRGTAPHSSVIEVFSDSLDQGRIFEGRTTADDEGNWTYSGTVTGPYATAVAIDDSGNTSEFSNYLAVSVERVNSKDVGPKEFFLNQNYPNPFNPETTISFGVREMSRVTLRIYNSLGQLVTTLINGNYQPGVYRVKFNVSGFASGIYIYQINMKGFSASRKMIIME